LKIYLLKKSIFKKKHLLKKSSFKKQYLINKNILKCREKYRESGDDSLFARGWRSSRSGNIESSLLSDNFVLKDTFFKDAFFKRPFFLRRYFLAVKNHRTL